MTNKKIPNTELSELIDRIYEAATLQKWHLFVRTLAAKFPGTFVTINGHSQPEGSFVIASSQCHSVGDDDKISFVPDFSFLQMSAKNDVGQVFCTRTRELPIGFEMMSGAVLAKGDGRLLFIGLCFSSAAQQQYVNDVEAMLELLVPHIVRATNLYRTLHATQTMASEFGGLMDTITMPVVVCDENGVFLIANNAGDEVLAIDGSLYVDDNRRVAISDCADTKILLSKIKQSVVKMAPTGLRIYVEGFYRSIRIVPFVSAPPAIAGLSNLLFSQRPRVSLFIGVKNGFTIDDNILNDVFGLTPREAEICRKILDLQTPAEIALEQNKSLRTVRNQVQAIYSKLGITRGAELSEALEIFKVTDRDKPK